MMLVTKVLKKTTGEDNKKTEMFVIQLYLKNDILTSAGS